MSGHICRFCATPLTQTFCNLGTSPASNSFIKPDNVSLPELFYALHVYICGNCKLVQLPEHRSPDQIFNDDYVYFSSYSDSWLAHAKRYCEIATARFELSAESQVIEVASNDGYLLKNFKAMGIPVLGIDPSASVAEAAERQGIKTLVAFFGEKLAEQLRSNGRQADLLIGNNVLAHVPDINDFVAGLRTALKPSGVITLEFPHIAQLISGLQFDTIYHEHYSYLSLTTVDRILSKHGLEVFDVEALATHGGSLRIFACHAQSPNAARRASVSRLLEDERKSGLTELAGYQGFETRVHEAKRALLDFLIAARRDGKRIAAYGAAAKGNTLLNYCGIRQDFIEFVADRSPVKQGRLLPGTRIPVKAPEAIEELKPDYLIVLPWNIRDEIIDTMSSIRSWGGKFVIPLPSVEVIS